MEIRPYPFHAWPRVSRREMALLRGAAQVLPLGQPQRVKQALLDLLGIEPTLVASPLEWCAAGDLARSLSEPLVAAVLAPADGRTSGHLAIEVDARLAACLVDRVLGGEAGSQLPHPTAPLSHTERGALGYLVARVLGDTDGFRLSSIVTTKGALCACLDDEGALVWPARVTLGADQGVVRAWIPERAVSLFEPRPRRGLGSLGRVELTLALEAARDQLDAAELRALREGDVVVFDQFGLARAAGGWAGTLEARVLGSLRATFTFEFDGESFTLARMAHAREAPPAEARTVEHDADQLATERLGDAPVEVAVEVARFTLPLAELSNLRPGQVLATGRGIGERVTLRAGGQAVATGELVDVEGEIGVRVLALAGP